jgi:hypothetical protein
MARIRNIKLHSIDIRPEFFRNEDLQDLESEYPDQHLMIVFAGLRSLCNINNRFPWDIDLISKYIYPKLRIDIKNALFILEKKGFIKLHQTHKSRKYFGILIDPDKLTRLTKRINHREEETPGYYLWRLSVLERDLYTCQKCGKSGCKLRVHHIKSYKDHPKLRIDLDNGITYCENCHKNCHRKKGVQNEK